ncbi:MAG TPA: MFS transporter [Tissierellia bacterium]|nr:MFS transporter [Tissierellia bacterium]
MEKNKPSLGLISSSFGLAWFGFTLLTSMNTTYYIYFLTDVVKFTPAAMGALLSAVRMIGLISSLLVGVLIEKTNFRWGRYRSWLLIAVPGASLFYALMFTNPDLSPSLKILYLGFIYVMMQNFLNLLNAASMSFISMITQTPNGRVLLSSRRAQFMSVGRIIFSIISMPLILFFNGGEGAKSFGYFAITALFGVICIGAHFIFFRLTEPYDKPKVKGDASGPTMSIKDMADQLTKNPPLLLLILSNSAMMTAFMVMSALAAYYFVYVVKNIAMITTYMTMISITQLIGSMATPRICKKCDKRTVYILGLLLVAGGHFLAWMFAKTAWVFIIINGIAYFGYAISTSTIGALYSDTCDYAEWKTGKSARGLIMSMSGIPPNIGIFLSSLILSLGLTAIGFQAGMDSTPSLVSGFNTLINLVPAGLMLLGALAVLFYSLTNTRVQQIQQECAERGQAPVQIAK